jgi:CDP-diacylglycerol---serine O-phosphatidyltransferase
MKKGIYLLPNLITLSSMFCGFYSIISAINGEYLKAALILIAAGILDILDGSIARLTNSTSSFGVEMDSLTDIVSFGIAPAILIYLYELQPFGKIGWMAAFIFVASGAMRLARSNVISKTSDQKSFIGLPIPSAAGMIISYTIFSHSPFAKYLPGIVHNTPLIAITVYILAILMVSNINYHSFKEFSIKNRKPFKMLILIFFLVFTIVTYYTVSLFILGIVYGFSGPFEYVIIKIKTLFHNRVKSVTKTISH